MRCWERHWWSDWYTYSGTCWPTCCIACWTRASHERGAVTRMAAERDAGIARAGRLGAALSWLAAVPRQWPGDGRAGDGGDHDRGIARRAVARVAGPDGT